MHIQEYIYVRDVLKYRFWDSVLEVGSRSVNGTVRGLVRCNEYHGVDLYPGTAVDEVADFTTWKPPKLYDLVLCLETLEHAPEWRTMVRRIAEALKPEGLAIVTAACDPRERHSGVDGTIGTLAPGEYYGNIDPSALDALARKLFTSVDTTVDEAAGDVRMTATK